MSLEADKWTLLSGVADESGLMPLGQNAGFSVSSLA